MTQEINKLRSRIEELEARVSLLQGQLSVAVQLLQLSPDSALAKSRVILERVVKDLYIHLEVPLPSRAHELGALLSNNQLKRLLPSRIVLRMNTVREFGNLGVHDKGDIATADAISCLTSLVEILDWYSTEVVGAERTVEPRSEGDDGAGAQPMPSAGALVLAVDATNRDQVAGLAASTSSFLDSEGLDRPAIEKCWISLQEMLTNVVKHAGDPQNLARVRLWMDSPAPLVAGLPDMGSSGPKTLRVTVSDRGRGFALAGAIVAGLAELKQTHREHGLLRMIRYGGGLSQQTVDGLHTIQWSAGGATPLDPSRPPWSDGLSALFLCTNPRVFPLVLHISGHVVLGREVYKPPEALAHVLTAAGTISAGIPEILSACGGLLNVLLDPLRRANPDVVIIGAFGRHPTIEFGDSTGRFEALASHAVAVARYYLPQTRLLVLADSEYETNHEWAQFARNHEIEFFENVADCERLLRSLARPD